jgi:acetolactate synthase-1/2/3 large subunit
MSSRAEEGLHDHKDDLVFIDSDRREANVFPMVAAGKGLSEMVLAEDL